MTDVPFMTDVGFCMYVFCMKYRNFRKLLSFLTGVLNFIFGKILGKFRKTFCGPKALYIFEKFSTVERFSTNARPFYICVLCICYTANVKLPIHYVTQLLSPFDFYAKLVILKYSSLTCLFTN